MATGNSKISYIGFEIICKCGDHITLTKTETNTYTGVCLGCGVDYVLMLIPIEEDNEENNVYSKKVKHNDFEDE